MSVEYARELLPPVRNPFQKPSEKYSIKQKSFYRPFKNVQECLEEMRKHERFGWINYEGKSTWYCITAIINTNVYFTNFYFGEWRNFLYAFNNCTFTDGSPFGIKIKEE